MFVVTIVGTPALSVRDAALASETCGSDDLNWIQEGRAVDLICQTDEPRHLRDRLEDALPHADIFVQRQDTRAHRLFVADMDSTMITVECIDELADYAGLKAEVAAVTEAAMRGELDFEGALRERVALLKGLAESSITDCLNMRVKHSSGAKQLIAGLKAAGIRTVLVSGGFTAFAEPVGQALGFDRVVANVLQRQDGQLTGLTEGPIVDAARKLAVLDEECFALGITRNEAIAIGDGANDLLMVEAAGLGIAYHAKPALAKAADVRIRNGDLSTVLYAVGLGAGAPN
ncbi:phosphoserine phosphatase SerB [Pacificimonas sp. ICDLI1SI03]